MDSVLQDLRYALRTLQRAPLFTVYCDPDSGLGIGATTVVFTILNGVVLRPLQYESVRPAVRCLGAERAGDYRWGPTQRSAIGARRATSLRLWRTSGDRPPSCRDMTALVRWAPRFVSDEFFEVLRGPPLIGRLFSPDEQRPGGAPVAVLTHALWREAFGGDRSAIGSTIG